MKSKHICSLLLWAAILLPLRVLKAQTSPAYSLKQLIDTTLANSKLISINSWEVSQRTAKLKEDEIKRYPSVQLDGSYQYNFNLPAFNIPAGAIGTMPGTSGEQLLPAEPIQLKLGQKSTYSTGISVYQPITQQAKIRTALHASQVDIRLAGAEKTRTTRELKAAVEKLFYGMLITRKQKEEATAKLELAKSRLSDIETANGAGKSIAADISGLQAAVAQQEQNILRLDMLWADYKSELASISHIEGDDFDLQPVEPKISPLVPEQQYRDRAAGNPDVQIARLGMEKAQLGLIAARQNNIPDLGLVAGYYYQKGNPMLPNSSPYIGISLKWNLQDLFSNGQLQSQRKAQLKQSEERLAYQQRQYLWQTGNAYRRTNQTATLIEVAQKAVGYRRQQLKVQQDKKVAGFNVATDLLEAKSELAKAESDLYAAQLAYLLAAADLENLAGE